MLLILASGGILSFDPGFAIWELITLIIFIFLMARYAVPVLRDSLEEREGRIKESLTSAEKALNRAQKISRENEQALRDAELKAQEIRTKAIDEAKAIREERIEKSKKEAQKIVEQARDTIKQEKQQALLELRDEVARLAVQAASKILKEEVDEEKNSKLVDDFISGLHKN
jgi:F-type H+-transporting ATPase subunit b